MFPDYYDPSLYDTSSLVDASQYDPGLGASLDSSSGVYDTTFSSTDPALTTSSGINWGQVGQFATTVESGAGGVLNGVASILNAGATKPNVAGSYNAQGQFVPLGRSTTGVLSTPGQTSILGNVAGAGGVSNIGSVLSGTLGSLTQYLPWLIIGVVGIVVLKAVTKR